MIFPKDLKERIKIKASQLGFIARGGHTASDAILHLPDDNIIFGGDLLFVHAHPYFADGHPEEFRQSAAYIKELRANVWYQDMILSGV